MMDWYSNFPPPSREEAAKEVVQRVLLNYPDYDKDKMLEICTKVVNDMPSLGSYTGWYVGFRSDAIKEVLNKINAGTTNTEIDPHLPKAHLECSSNQEPSLDSTKKI
jgi:hypothetical protein